jgi:hypothetical protein
MIVSHDESTRAAVEGIFTEKLFYERILKELGYTPEHLKLIRGLQGLEAQEPSKGVLYHTSRSDWSENAPMFCFALEEPYSVDEFRELLQGAGLEKLSDEREVVELSGDEHDSSVINFRYDLESSRGTIWTLRGSAVPKERLESFMLSSKDRRGFHPMVSRRAGY